MLKYKLGILLLTLFEVNILSQIDPKGDIFITKQPIWSHVTFDTSAVGYKSRTGMDYCHTLVDARQLIWNDKILNVHHNDFDAHEGAYIEQLDLKDGKLIWSKAFDLRSNSKRERVCNYYLNQNSQIELLLSQSISDKLDPPFNTWSIGNLAIRKFDFFSGDELYSYHAPTDDSTFVEYQYIFDTPLMFRNFKNEIFYITAGFDFVNLEFGFTKYIMDTLGKKIRIEDGPRVKAKYGINNSSEDFPRRLYGFSDTLIRMYHTYKNPKYVSGDSMELFFEIFDNEFNLIRRFDVADKVSKIKEYQISSLKNQHLGIYGVEYTSGFHPREHLFVFDYYGNLIEEIIYPHRRNEENGIFLGMTKLKHEPGIIFVNMDKLDIDDPKLLFYKSDGKGNIELLQKIRLKDSYALVIGAYLEELESSKILFSGLYRQLTLSGTTYTTTERFITSLWDFDLGTNSDGPKKQSAEIKFSPNPAGLQFQIEGDIPVNSTYEIYGLNGHLLNQGFISTAISLSGIPAGLLNVLIISEDGTLIYSGKLIKQ